MAQRESGLLAAAKAGDLDKIYELCGGGEDEDEDYDEDDDDAGANEADEQIYKWLLVAADFGHDAAGEAADDMLETSSLRYDDGNMVQGLIHFELGEAYLRGDDGLPVDLTLAKNHLQMARKLDVHESTDLATGFPALRKKLSPVALEVFDKVFPDRGSKSSLPPKPSRPV